MDPNIGPGTILAGKFRVERVLGRGGMGVVVAAHHLVLDEPVALKFLLPEAMASADAVMRFEREARAAAKIKSEHIARVSDVGRLEDGAPYMVMELLQGRDLGQLLQVYGRLQLEDAADYLLQAGEALAEAHGLGIVHRDLKPQNLFLTQRPDGSSCVKVLDFGISKVSGGASEQRMTSTTAIMGSPLYMSPEQLLSAREVDMRTDMWALGVIFFELLTGQTPFLADTLPQLCMAIATAPPSRLHDLRPDLPPEVEQLILRCLEKDRTRRMGSVAELARELVKLTPQRGRLSAERIERLAVAAGFTSSSPAMSSALGPVAQPATAASQTVGGFGNTKPAGARSNAPAVFSVIFGVLVVAAGVAFAILRRHPTVSPEPVVSTVTAAPVTAVAAELSPQPAVPLEPAKPPAAVAPPPSAEPAAEPTAKPKITGAAAAPRGPAGKAPPTAAPKPVDPKPKPGQDGLGGRL